jgi:hypothetical protein
MNKVISYAWFNTLQHCIGVVVVQKIDGSRSSYIGVVPGEDERYDAVYVAERGAKFSLNAAKILISEHGEKLIKPIEFPL